MSHVRDEDIRHSATSDIACGKRASAYYDETMPQRLDEGGAPISTHTSGAGTAPLLPSAGPRARFELSKPAGAVRPSVGDR